MNPEFIKYFSLENKKALILGASKGIGLSCSQFISSMGASVFGVAREIESLNTMKKSLYGEGHEILSSDLSTNSGIEELLKKLNEWGTPDIVIANLYIRKPSVKLVNLKDISATDIYENLNYLLKLVPFFLPEQRKKKFGRWIGVSSMAATFHSPGQMIYSLQKKAMESILKTLAVEEGKFNITANIVSPGIILTPGTENNYPKELLQTFSKMNALGRAGTTEEVAHLISFLASPVSSYITGVNIPICGGYDLGWAVQSAIEGKLNL